MAMALVVVFTSTSIHAGTKVGMSAALQDQQTDLLIPIWTSSSLAIVPSFSFISLGDVGTDLGVSVAVRGYFADRDGLRPYLGGRGGLLMESPKDGDSRTDYILGGFFGGEYFFSDHFSMGVEGQLNVTVSDENSYRFGNPDNTNFNTAAVVSATVYF
jgi:hypothetical protein